MNSCRCTHTPSGICTAKGAQKWQNFLSCNIHVAYLSHQFENLSLFGPFNVFSFLSEIELLWFAQSVCRTQMRPAEAELSADFTQYVNLCPQKLLSQVNRTKSRKKEERWSDGPRSCSRHWWQQWDQDGAFLNPRTAPCCTSPGAFYREDPWALRIQLFFCCLCSAPFTCDQRQLWCWLLPK